ncbi:MAG: recombination regulator RecX [Treponema sp.]|nr:recombination regulator RecX [Treponema sp.]
MNVISLGFGAESDIRHVGLSDGSSLLFRLCYLSPDIFDENLFWPDSPDCIVGRELEPGEEEALLFAAECLTVEKAALNLVAYAEQSVFGLNRKLAQRGHGRAGIKAVLARLCDLGLVDDERYCRFWLEARLAREGMSPARLLAGLYGKGVARGPATSAVEALLDDDAEDLLLANFVRKLERRGTSTGDPALKYVLRREGFSGRAIEVFLEDG